MVKVLCSNKEQFFLESYSKEDAESIILIARICGFDASVWWYNNSFEDGATAFKMRAGTTSRESWYMEPKYWNIIKLGINYEERKEELENQMPRLQRVVKCI